MATVTIHISLSQVRILLNLQWLQQILLPPLAGEVGKGLTLNNTDKDGYLLHLQDWNEEVAQLLAERENLFLSEEHWLVINFLRNFYQEYNIVPAMRVLVKELAKQMPAEKSNSSHLQQLFPGGLFRQGCKLAGLPKPARCV